MNDCKLPNTAKVNKDYLKTILNIYFRKLQRLELSKIKQDLLEVGFKTSELQFRINEVKYFIEHSPILLQTVIDKYFGHPNLNRSALLAIFDYLVTVDDIRKDNENLTSFLDDAWLINSICSKHVGEHDINFNLKRLNHSARTAIKLLTNNELNKLEKIIQANRLFEY